MTMNQTQQRFEGLQHEATRLAHEARTQLADYARKMDMSQQTADAQSAFQNGRVQLQHAANQVSDQAAAAMAAALEDAAARLRTYTGDGPAAQLANNAATALEHGSDYLQPWSMRSIVRRATHVVREYPIPTIVVVGGVAVMAYLINHSRSSTHA